MSVKPTTVPTWDSTLTHVVAITGGHASAGFANAEVPGSGELNTAMNLYGQWCQYLSDGNLVRAEQEIFVPVPEFATAGTDFSGTAKSITLSSHLPLGSKITTVAASMKGPGSGLNSNWGVEKYLSDGTSAPLGGPGPTIEANTYHFTAAFTYNYTPLTGEVLVGIWTSTGTGNLRGFVVRFIPPTAI